MRGDNNMSKYNNEKNDPRLIKKLGSGRMLCSVIAPDPNSKYENIILEFIEFDPKTNKRTNEIDFFFEPGSFLSLCQQIINNTVSRFVKADYTNMKAQGLKYSQTTGTKSPFFRRGGGEVNNQLKYREFYIHAASEPNKALLVVEQMDGYKDKIGLINPKSGNNNKTALRIPVSFQDLLDTACLVQARMNAYYVAKQLSGAYDRVPKNVAQVVEEVPAENNNYNEIQQVEEYSEPIETVGQSGVPEIDPDEAFYSAYNAQYS